MVRLGEWNEKSMKENGQDGQDGADGLKQDVDSKDRMMHIGIYNVDRIVLCLCCWSCCLLGWDIFPFRVFSGTRLIVPFTFCVPVDLILFSFILFYILFSFYLIVFLCVCVLTTVPCVRFP